MITFKHRGNFTKTYEFLNRNLVPNYLSILHRYGKEGVDALSSATPVDTGETANCWYYDISNQPGKIRLTWYNSNMAGDIPLAILIQYGHGTRNGGFVQGQDFINPALRSIFDKISKDVWKEVIR